MTKKSRRLKDVVKSFSNISLRSVVDALRDGGFDIKYNPNEIIDEGAYNFLTDKFHQFKKKNHEIIHHEKPLLDKKQETTLNEPIKKAPPKEDPSLLEVIRGKADLLHSPKVLGKIENVEFYKKNQEEKEQKGNYVKESTKEKGPSFPERKKEQKNTPLKKDSINKSQQKPLEKLSLQPQKRKEQEEQEGYKEQKTAPLTKEKKQENESIPIAQKEKKPNEHIHTQYKKLDGLTFTGDKVDLSLFEKQSKDEADRRKRKRIRKELPLEKEKVAAPTPKTKTFTHNKSNFNNHNKGSFKKAPASHASDTHKRSHSANFISKEHTTKLTEPVIGGTKSGKNKLAHLRRERRLIRKEKNIQKDKLEEGQNKTLKVAEFITVNDMASIMEVSSIEVINACMSLGIMVTMNQRLDAEILELVADEFGFDIVFLDADLNNFGLDEDQQDLPEDLHPRPPIVTVMGHVDHGKTSLLDYIRKSNIIAGESGGITQHIAAYNVRSATGGSITFLDTPGHEAFTAMRARGAQITDIAIVVIAADDQVMPQTKEAISHAQAANIPIIFAINKIDKPGAQPDKVREQLASMNFLVEEWGGKYQSQEISAKLGNGVSDLLEKVKLQAEILELKANPNKTARGTVIEASLDKGRGYTSTLLIEAGTLKVGDYVVAGTSHGKVKRILDERGNLEKQAGPSKPISILGLNGAPAAGDKFRVFLDEREAKQLASKKEQLQREQSFRAKKHLTLDEIGRRIALGNFRELKIIIKADVDGSVEALADSFQKLSTEELLVSVIHKGVGQITESDVLLATASDAIIIGFNVRPALGARNLADKENIEINTYSVIYNAIDDVKEALEGMRSPELKEQILGNAEVREVFKISKIGTIAGCFIVDGKLSRHSKVRLIREGIVIYDGGLESLKRFKEDVKEVLKGYECGLGIKNYNDIRPRDYIEAYEEVKV